jgi:hypothetical protein
MSITLTDFTEKFATIFEDTDPESITPDTQFRNLEEWDSMIALSLIAMADVDDIRSSNSVNDLFEKIKNKNS